MKDLKLAILLALLLIPVHSHAQQGFDPSTVKSDTPIVNFNSQAFQAAINTTRDIGDVARQNSPLKENATAYGFGAKSDEARFFLIGAIYTEALAYLKSGKPQLAAQRLEYMEKEFINMGAPSSLYSFISKMRNLIESNKYPPQYLETVLPLFQPFFEEYAKTKSKDELVLFRAGAWLVNMSLAAAAGDKQLLRQPADIEYFITELKRTEAPKGVIASLDEINKISRKKEITDKDTERVLKLVKRVEEMLS